MSMSGRPKPDGTSRAPKPTIVGYAMCGQDDRATMYSNVERIDSVPAALLRDSSQSAHATLCGVCKRKLDPNWINPRFRVSNRRRDITCTYDGYTLVSARFRAAWREWGHFGAVFLDLPNDSDFFALSSDQILPFDYDTAQTRFEDYCEACRSFRTVVGTHPARLKGISEPLTPGLYRTDVSFACGIEQHPLLIVDASIRERIKTQKLSGFDFSPIEA